MTHDNVTDIVERLLDVCVDWDGTQMNDAEEPRTWLTVGEIREAADTIATLRKQLENAREALRNIKIEAEREQGHWQHLKRVIAVHATEALKGQPC